MKGHSDISEVKEFISRLFDGRIQLISGFENALSKCVFWCNRHKLKYAYVYQNTTQFKSGGCPECAKEQKSSREPLDKKSFEKQVIAFEIKAEKAHPGKFKYLQYQKKDKGVLFVQVQCKKHKSTFEFLGTRHITTKSGGCPDCLNEIVEANNIIDYSSGKTCNHCGIVKSVDEFPVSKYSKSGNPLLHHICKECKKDKDREYDQNKRDKKKAKEAVRRYAAKPERKEHQKQYHKTRYIESNASHAITIIKCTECESTELIRRDSDRTKCTKCANRERYLASLPETRICKQCNDRCALKHSYLCKECKEGNKKQYNRAWKRKLRKVRGSESHRERAKRFGVYYDPSVKKGKVLQRDKHRCCYCGCKVQTKDYLADNAAELDHIIPMSKGGPHTWANVQTLCRACNGKKSDNILHGVQLSLAM